MINTMIPAQPMQAAPMMGQAPHNSAALQQALAQMLAPQPAQGGSGGGMPFNLATLMDMMKQQGGQQGRVPDPGVRPAEGGAAAMGPAYP